MSVAEPYIRHTKGERATLEEIAEAVKMVSAGKTRREVAEALGRSNFWVSHHWHKWVSKTEAECVANVEEWRDRQLREIADLKTVAREAIEQEREGREDGGINTDALIKAVTAYDKLIGREMSLTGTTRPIPVELIEGGQLQRFVDEMDPADVAKLAVGDPETSAKIWGKFMKAAQP